MGGLSHTVSGDIASFRTPSRVPIESLKIHFLPKQAAGTPTPENPIPIEGWTGLNGRRAGKNLIKPYYTEPTTYYGIPITPTANGVRVTGTAVVECAIRLSSMDVRFLDEGKKYTFSLYVNGDISGCKDPYIGYFDGVSYWGTMGSLTEANNHKLTWTVPNRYATAVAPWFDMYIRIREGSTVDFEIGLQMEEGSNATDFEPYSEELIPITFPSNGKNIVDWPTPDGFSVAASLFNGWNANWIRGPIYVDRSNFGKRIIYSAIIDNTNGIRDAALHVWVKDKNEAYVTSGITSEFVPVGSSKRVYAVVPITGTSWYKIYLGLTIGSGCIVSNPMAEYSMSMTDYEPYSSDNTFYGGYIDPVAGEIVAEWAEKILDGTETWNVYGAGSSEGTSFSLNIASKAIGWHTSMCNVYKNINGAWEAVPAYVNGTGIYSDHHSNRYIYVRKPTENVTTLEDFKQWLSENKPKLYYKLKTPIRIPVPAQDLKAFLDHNNFWSDANDITEVTYAVTESKDMLATRKKAMAFDIGHRKKVWWNQLARDISTSHWRMYSSNALRGTISDGIAECYYVTNKQYARYVASITTMNSISWDADHYYYASYMVKPTYDGKFGIEFARGKQIQGMASAYANEWKRARTKQKPSATGYSGLYIPFPDPVGPIDEGYQVKAPFVVDLTLMFGAGNEPATQAEFEHICELNGIDLTTYQPYDEGSDRWLIVP